jgi:hypothetical protein
MFRLGELTWADAVGRRASPLAVRGCGSGPTRSGCSCFLGSWPDRDWSAGQVAGLGRAASRVNAVVSSFRQGGRRGAGVRAGRFCAVGAAGQAGQAGQLGDPGADPQAAVLFEGGVPERVGQGPDRLADGLGDRAADDRQASSSQFRGHFRVPAQDRLLLAG